MIKKIISILLILISFESVALVAISGSKVSENNPSHSPQEKANQKGCCSWHGGVCGCRGGRALCCDGTLSPTCRC